MPAPLTKTEEANSSPLRRSRLSRTKSDQGRNQPLVLHVADLSKHFLRGNEEAIVADVTFSAAAGQCLSLEGPAAAATTVLKCLYGTYTPASGNLLYITPSGRTIDLAAAEPPDLAELRRTEIQLVSATPASLRRTAADLVAAPLLALGYEPAAARDRACQTLREMGLSEIQWDRRIGELSHFEQRLAGLARALVVPPRLLLLDAPFARLLGRERALVLELLRTAKQRRAALVGAFQDHAARELLADARVDVANAQQVACA